MTDNTGRQDLHQATSTELSALLLALHLPAQLECIHQAHALEYQFATSVYLGLFLFIDAAPLFQRPLLCI